MSTHISPYVRQVERKDGLFGSNVPGHGFEPFKLNSEPARGLHEDGCPTRSTVDWRHLCYRSCIIWMGPRLPVCAEGLACLLAVVAPPPVTELSGFQVLTNGG